MKLDREAASIVPHTEAARKAVLVLEDGTVFRVVAVVREGSFGEGFRMPASGDLSSRNLQRGLDALDVALEPIVADSLLERNGFKLPVPVRQAKLTRSCR